MDSLAIFPVIFSKNNFPIIKLDITGKSYPFALSLSSKYPLFTNAELLEKISKTKKGEAQWKDAKGNLMQSDLFEIPLIQMGHLQFKNILSASTLLSSNEEECEGSFSWPWNKMNVLLDFPHYRICGINQKKCLNEFGISLEKMEKIKCKINNGGGGYFS